jgi:hypothetical protein
MSFLSKLFRTQQRVHQINEQQQRRDASDNVVHATGLLKSIAGLDKGPGSDEKQNSDEQVDYVEHDSSLDWLCRLPEIGHHTADAKGRDGRRDHIKHGASSLSKSHSRRDVRVPRARHSVGAPRFKHKLEETVKKEALAGQTRKHEKCFAHFAFPERNRSSRPEEGIPEEIRNA